MDISFSNPQIALIFGGLFSIILPFVDIDRYQNRISLNISERSKTYLRLFGIILIIIGLFLPPNGSEQHNDVPITINNNLTQIATSEQKERVSMETLEQKINPIIKPNIPLLMLNFYGKS